MTYEIIQSFNSLIILCKYGLDLKFNKHINLNRNNVNQGFEIIQNQIRSDKEQEFVFQIVEQYVIWIQKHKLDQQSLSNEGFQIMHTNKICHIDIQKILIKNLKYLIYHNVYDHYGYTRRVWNIQGSEALRDAIRQFSNLINFKLNLEDINIGPRQMEIISEGIKHLKNLKYFALDVYSYSQIRELGCQGIGNALSNLILLEELQIIIQKWNKIKSKGAIDIGKGIRNLKKLQKLNIQFGDDNFINMEGIKGFFEGVQDLNDLKELYFYFGEIGFKQFGIAIQSLQKLKKLDMFIDKNNKISPRGVAFIQKGFQALSQNLVDLKLTFYFDPDFTNQSIFEFANSLKCLQSLKNLQLEINSESNIEQRAGLELYRSISELKNLQSIQLNLDKQFILQFYDLKIQSNIIEERDNLTELCVSVDIQNIQVEGIQSLTQALKRLVFLQRLQIQILPNTVHAEGARNLAFSFFYLQNFQKLNLKSLNQTKLAKWALNIQNKI
ncbi:hypothetical protein ABPG72_005461 [Tetrahymena utriculariae]